MLRELSELSGIRVWCVREKLKTYCKLTVSLHAAVSGFLPMQRYYYNRMDVDVSGEAKAKILIFLGFSRRAYLFTLYSYTGISAIAAICVPL